MAGNLSLAECGRCGWVGVRCGRQCPVCDRALRVGRLVAALGALALALGVASTADAAELPADSVCRIVAELAYDEAVAVGDGLPDGAYEAAMGACDWDSEFGAGVPLNELVAVDGEVWLPVCQFDGGCVR